MITYRTLLYSVSCTVVLWKSAHMGIQVNFDVNWTKHRGWALFCETTFFLFTNPAEFNQIAWDWFLEPGYYFSSPEYWCTPYRGMHTQVWCSYISTSSYFHISMLLYTAVFQDKCQVNWPVFALNTINWHDWAYQGIEVAPEILH